MWIWFVLISSLLNILIGMMFKTNNLPSFLLFKAIPFFAGLGSLMYFLIEKGLI